MKFLKRFLLLILFLLVVVLLAAYWFLNASKPQFQGEITVAGLEQDVEIRFDLYGIPHIYAQNEADLYFALGYVHAQDRLFQMELLRRVGAGRLAEIFGPELAPTDQFMRTIGIDEMARTSAKAYLSQNVEPFQQGALAYLNGINTFLHHGPTPPEFAILSIPKEDFTTTDLYRIAGYMGFSFNTAIRTDPLMTRIASQWDPRYLNDLALNTTADNTTIPTFRQDTLGTQAIMKKAMAALRSLPVPLWLGSNSWVVGPQKTKSGYPMLANDTHIGFGQPAVWYEAHLSCPGFNFYGNHLAGFPFALVGHNDYHAWGITIFPNDDMDFYREKINADNPQQVWNTDHWEDLASRKEVIKIKGASEQEFVIRSSRHGPIINEVNAAVDSLESQPVSLFWTYLKFPNKTLQMAYGMAHSQHMDEFRAAVSLLEAPGLNITYADRGGNIAWWAAARLVKRPLHVEPKLILDGSSGLDDPLGWYDFSANPKAENPDEGFVYSANNQPDSAYGILHSGYYYPGARGKRIMELLSNKDDWDLESFQKMALDDTSPIYPIIVKKITSQLQGELTPLQQEARDILDRWDGSHGLQELGPTIFYRLIYQLQKDIFEDELGAADFNTYITTLVARRSLEYILDKDNSPWWDDQNTPAKESREQIIHASFQKAVAVLESNLGANSNLWKWEKVHRLEHQHAIGRQKPFNYLFNVGPFPVPGGDEVINKMDFNKNEITYQVRSGPAMRILIDLNDLENSLSVLPTGQGGHPLSPHYNDQAPLYNSGKFRPQVMDRDKIISQSPESLILKAENP